MYGKFKDSSICYLRLGSDYKGYFFAKNLFLKNMIKNNDIYMDRILVLDFYSQYTQLIARRIRELGVYCEVFVFSNITDVLIRQFSPSGIILSGSPSSISDRKHNRTNLVDSIPKCIFQFNVPILGICYGMHVMAVWFGGIVGRLSKREFGHVKLKVVNDSVLMRDIYDDINNKGTPVLDVWMSHSDAVISVPKDFVVVGSTDQCDVAVMANEKKRLYGIQFHPEVTHTLQGTSILRRFVFDICSCKSLWNSSSIIHYLVTQIKNIVKNDCVLLAFSGGIDSLVTALLLQRAVGNQRLICYFVDTGLLRRNESVYINKLINDYSLNIFFISASDRFFNALSGISDPEKKRKIIAQVFIDIFNEQRKDLPNNVKWLAQGTIYPDVIESGTVNSFNNKDFVIKSHHNVSAIFNIKAMKLLEPIRFLFKDEVKKIGVELGISFDTLCRHPFPGPGFGVRILGEVKKEYCNLLRHADDIFIEELKRYNLYTKISQAFAVFLPIQSVGIMGDVRKYEWVISLRAVESVDFMTARWAQLPYDFLCCVSSRIINEVHGISRVVYDISNKPPSTIEWE